MGSEANKFNDGTSFQPTEPTLCTNGCGFFGTAATMGLCSKCYRDIKLKEDQETMAKVAMEKLVIGKSRSPPSTAVVTAEKVVDTVVGGSDTPKDDTHKTRSGPNRCLTCNKKVGVVGFKCRCGCTFCGTHRYPEQHGCTFDFKSKGKEELAKANPVVKADKINRF